MSRFSVALAVGITLLTALVFASPASALDEQGSQHWKDFIHYSRVARLDLAAANGQALVEMALAPEALLEVVEESPYAKGFAKDLERMKRMSGEGTHGVADVAARVEKAIDDAKIAVIRNIDRIAGEIDKLDTGLRARTNAVRRLKEAGEYATPQLLKVVLAESDRDKQLRPYAIEALAAIGRPVVLPLSESLRDLPAATQQDVARILGRIRYPLALPYLKQLAEDPQTDESTHAVVVEALLSVTRGRELDPQTSAASLYLKLARDYYDNTPSLTLEPDAETNLRWMVSDGGNLTYQRVPTAIYIDVMAMQAARRALELDADLGDALSVWITANFRRENRLPEGVNDPSYGEEMRSPRFYATLAGPDHVTPTLVKALAAHDAELALDGIRALAATAGGELLVEAPEALVQALSASDRRVRYEAAFAIAHAKPAEDFEGAGRVIPVLAEAVRQTTKPVALVVAEQRETLNGLSAAVRDAGQFEVIQATDIVNLGDELLTVTGVDLVVIQGPVSTINAFNVGRAQQYKVASAPMVAVAGADQISAVNRLFADDTRTVVTPADGKPAQLAAAINQALATMRGGAIDEAQAEAYATESLSLLEDLAIAESQVLDASLAKAAVIEALDDPRTAVVIAAAAVLAEVGGPEGQQAIADAALDAERDEGLRITLLGSLGRCARNHGTQISLRQATRLRQLVDGSSGEMADAAAAAYGALNMPSAHSTKLIVD